MVPIILKLFSVHFATYYSQNYSSIIYKGLTPCIYYICCWFLGNCVDCVFSFILHYWIVCGHFCHKPKQSVETVPPLEETPGLAPSPLYDDIQPRRNEEEVDSELKTKLM